MELLTLNVFDRGEPQGVALVEPVLDLDRNLIAPVDVAALLQVLQREISALAEDHAVLALPFGTDEQVLQHAVGLDALRQAGDQRLIQCPARVVLRRQ